VDAVLLDNMTVDEMQRAVAMAAGKAITEPSGRVTPATAPAIAATGVDLTPPRNWLDVLDSHHGYSLPS
jgi:nicotinate-nucleotide pyrophosphorylase (carboxylating)